MSGLPPCPHCGQQHAEDVLLCPNTEKLIPLSGRVLDGKFRFVKQLGEGGMGAVWMCENILVKKTVAIKLMHVQFSRDEGVLARFRNEATSAGRIGSKHICDILDLGRSQLGPYIVMEMLKGADLAQFVQTRSPVDSGRSCWRCGKRCSGSKQPMLPASCIATSNPKTSSCTNPSPVSFWSS